MLLEHPVLVDILLFQSGELQVDITAHVQADASMPWLLKYICMQFPRHSKRLSTGCMNTTTAFGSVTHITWRSTFLNEAGFDYSGMLADREVCTVSNKQCESSRR